jgi:hypothetical protein
LPYAIEIDDAMFIQWFTYDMVVGEHDIKMRIRSIYTMDSRGSIKIQLNCQREVVMPKSEGKPFDEEQYYIKFACMFANRNKEGLRKLLEESETQDSICVYRQMSKDMI